MAEPLATCMEIMGLRAYVTAYVAVARAEGTAQDVPGRMAELVRRNRERANKDRLLRQPAWEATDGIAR